MSSHKLRNWWRQYPREPYLQYREFPGPQDVPRLRRGDVVRLRGKPDSLRRVLNVEWHCYRHEFVYIVETSDCDPSRVYWFYEQLALEAEPKIVDSGP